MTLDGDLFEEIIESRGQWMQEVAPLIMSLEMSCCRTVCYFISTKLGDLMLRVSHAEGILCWAK